MAELSEGHTVKRYDGELAHLQLELLAMGGLVLDQVEQAVGALIDADGVRARRVIGRDRTVDEYAEGLDEATVSLLALRQPMGSDLRVIIAMTRAVADLERIGDEAAKIARVALDLQAHGESIPGRAAYRDVRALAELAGRLLRRSLEALDAANASEAAAIARDDLELDQIFASSLRHLATYVMENTRHLGHSIQIVLVLKALERIGDHACNLCRHVIYVVEGRDERRGGWGGGERRAESGA